ncbi:MAG: polyphenol oxidase family protein [Acidimicrobiaceae bacterium]|nr:polyphenol oxidase family protein [Acidimicrobiaceae bacterium]
MAGGASPIEGAATVPGIRRALASGAKALFTDRGAGDLGGRSPGFEERRRAAVDLPWTVLRQVHGSRVVVVERPGQAQEEEADAIVTACRGAALAILTADCAPVAFSSPEGIIGVAHAGWRGIAAGVLEATAARMTDLGATDVTAVLGPCIHPCCYEFGAADLAVLAARFGTGVEALDRQGRPALDVPAAVAAALEGAGVRLAEVIDVCTGCSPRHWSWRARQDTERQAGVVWR